MTARTDLDSAWGHWTSGKATLFESWKKANPGEYRKLVAYRAGGPKPTLATETGKALLDESSAWVQLGPVEPPPPPPPPPGDGVLAFAPPGYSGGDPRNPQSFPGFKIVDITAPGRYTYADSDDLYFRIKVSADAPTSGARAAVNIVGGRHRSIIAPMISIRPKTTQGDASDPTALLLDDGNGAGVTHVEGGDFRGNANGITVRGPQLYQIVYNRFEVAAFNGNHDSCHPDVIQIWDRTNGNARLKVDYLSSRSEYTGFSVLIDNPASWIMRHVDHQGPQGPAVYYGDGHSCEWSGDACFFKGCKLDDALAGWGGDNARYEIHAGMGLPPVVSGGVYTSPNVVTGGDCPAPLGTRQGDWITYNREPKLVGMSWTQGVPSAGDFVPANAVGAAYTPKGYA